MKFGHIYPSELIAILCGCKFFVFVIWWIGEYVWTRLFQKWMDKIENVLETFKDKYRFYLGRNLRLVLDDKKENHMRTVIIAGKNDIAVGMLDYILDTYVFRGF